MWGVEVGGLGLAGKAHALVPSPQPPISNPHSPMIDITSEPIHTAAVLAQGATHEAGAVVLFLGTTREFTAGRQTAALDYECYGDMAREQLTRLEAEARSRWPLVGCAIVHRVGRVSLGEASVAVAVSTAHRQAAFEAGKWLIDTLKQVV